MPGRSPGGAAPRASNLAVGVAQLAEADLDLKALFRALHDHGCAGRILCESPIMEEDSLNMKKAWMKVSGEKE